MKITLYTLTSDTDSGMTTEIFGSRKAQLESMHDTVAADDPKLADELRSLDPDSDEWGELWFDWTEEQSFRNDYYSTDEHEVEIELPAS